MQITVVKGPRYKIDDKERQQSAMGTRKGTTMHSRHSNALQETARFTAHCMGGDYIVATRCGNPDYNGGVAMGAGQHRGSTGTNEPDLARTSCCCLGRIAIQVPVS